MTLEQVRGSEAPHDDIIYLYYTHNQEKKVSSTQSGAQRTKPEEIFSKPHTNYIQAVFMSTSLNLETN